MISQWALVYCHLPFIDHVWCNVNISSRYIIMGSLGTWPLLQRLRRNRQSDWYAHIWRPLYLSVHVSFMPINGNAWCHQYYGLIWAYWYLCDLCIYQSMSLLCPNKQFCHVISPYMELNDLVCAAAMMTHIWALFGHIWVFGWLCQIWWSGVSWRRSSA